MSNRNMRQTALQRRYREVAKADRLIEGQDTKRSLNRNLIDRKRALFGPDEEKKRETTKKG